MQLEALTLLIVGCSLKLRSSAARRNSTHSCALPAQQQQSGPDISQLTLEMKSQWDHDKNAHLGSIVIKPQSNRKVHWMCKNCPDGHPHVWEAIVQSRSNGRGCPFCSGRKVCPHNSLHRLAPQVAVDRNIARNPGSPCDYTARSYHQAHWRCNQCGHEWQARIANRVGLGTGCPLCASKSKRRRPTVAASSSSMKQLWDSQRNAEQGLNADAVTTRSHQKANFTCDKCLKGQAHSWTARVADVFRGSGCPYCSGHRVCKCNSLQTLRPDLSAEWRYGSNKGTPDDYTANSRAVVWWQNNKRGRWKESINSRFYSRCNPQVCKPLFGVRGAIQTCQSRNQSSRSEKA